MVSIPCSPPISPVRIFGDRIRPFHTRPDNTNICAFDEPAGRYAVPPVVETGEGYYVFSWEDEVSVPIPPTNVPTADVTIPLSYTPVSRYPGWHIAGNPYGVAIDWDDVLAQPTTTNVDHTYHVYSSNTGPQYYNPLTAGAGGRTAIIEPGTGFWVHAFAAPAAVTIPLPVLGPPAKPVASKRDSSAWMLQVCATCAGGTDDVYNYVGCHPEASDGYDGRDVVESPPMNNDAVMLYFPHPEWPGDRSGNYTQDVRWDIEASGEGITEWCFEVKCGLLHERIKLTWPNIACIEGCCVELVDRETGKTVDMRAASSYAFMYGQGQQGARVSLSDAPAYGFALTVGTSTGTEVVSDAKVPDRFCLGQAYPNPFNPSTTIQYEVPEASLVRIEVCNSIGQQVAVLVDGMRAPGYYQVHWNGRDAGGLSVASGVYFYRMEAKSFTNTRRLLLLR